MKRIFRVVLCALLGHGAVVSAATPFKLGTFDAQGRVFVGAVVDEARVIDLGAAASALKRPPASAPRDMRDLIARYDSGGVHDLIVAAVAAAGASPKPSYVMDL